MPNLARVRVAWSGAPVIGPSVSTFYFEESGTGFVASLFSFFDGAKNRHPSSLNWTIPNTGDLIDVASGELAGVWTDGTGSVVTGTGGATYAQGVGYRVSWSTSGIRGDRRVRGTTFMAPMDLGMLDAAGTLGAVQMTALTTLANNLATGGTHNMVIYSAPHTGAADGQSNPVTGGSVPDQISWLRSRRT